MKTIQSNTHSCPPLIFFSVLGYNFPEHFHVRLSLEQRQFLVQIPVQPLLLLELGFQRFHFSQSQGQFFLHRVDHPSNAFQMVQGYLQVFYARVLEFITTVNLEDFHLEVECKCLQSQYPTLETYFADPCTRRSSKTFAWDVPRDFERFSASSSACFCFSSLGSRGSTIRNIAATVGWPGRINNFVTL